MMSGFYNIPLHGLKEGLHEYNFEIGNAFFEQFEDSEIKEGELVAVANLAKRSTHLDLSLVITGWVRICCDRCLEMFAQRIDCENRLLVRVGKNWDEDDPDLLTIPTDQSDLELSQYLYEFIHLALPLKRVHPDNSDGTSGCDPDMLNKIKEYNSGKDIENDPRWDQLKKLMNNN